MENCSYLHWNVSQKIVERRKKLKFQQEYINNLDYQTESVKTLEVKSYFFFHNLEHKYEQLILIL